MYFGDLLSMIDEDTHLIIHDVENNNNRIELEADNSFLKFFDYCKVKSIFADVLYIDLYEVDDEHISR